MATYFESINVSAVHIYHSALELSPLSSVVRQLYYHQRHTPFPHVVTGTPGSWNQGIKIGDGLGSNYRRFTWSPCGQLIAAGHAGGVEIRDQRSSELLSTLRPTEPPSHFTDSLAYSPDGHSLAAFLGTSLIIWDIQTGGLAREAECGFSNSILLVWSLDGQKNCNILWDTSIYPSWTVYVYNVDSGIAQSPGGLQSTCTPQLWAYGKSFRIMVTRWSGQSGQSGQSYTIDIFEVGFILTKIESFLIRLGERGQVRTFSPTTYQISSTVHSLVSILDVQTSECSLTEECGNFLSDCFSSDGSIFAVSSPSSIRTWIYDSGHYTLWRKFPTQGFGASFLQFSPTLSSIAGYFTGALQVWRLDLPPTIVHPDNCAPLATLSHQGSYVATAHHNGHTVTITNLLSQTPQFIDTDMDILELALTGNVLLVLATGMITAWQLTEEGVVDGIFGDRRVCHMDNIWTVALPSNPTFSVEDQTVAIKLRGSVIHAYHMRTGELFEPAQMPPQTHNHRYSLWDLMHGRHYLHYRELNAHNTHAKNDWPVSQITLQEGWVKDPEGRYRLWIPTEWRVSYLSAGWLYNIPALRINFLDRTIIVKF